MTTAENQQAADERIPHLLRVPARVRGLSVEPQLGPVDLSRYMRGSTCVNRGLGWVICGGESGPHARPFDLAWMRSLAAQCRAAEVPFFAKQLGADAREQRTSSPGTYGQTAIRLFLRDSRGGDESEWPADLRGLRAFPM